MRPVHRLQIALVILLIAGLAPAALHAAEDNVPRTASGHPDLSGTYDAATLTPLERPKEFGDKLYMTREEAEKIAADQAALDRPGEQGQQSRSRRSQSRWRAGGGLRGQSRSR